MAGDWIKVEKGCGQKPEVLKIARMLGINRRECYGLLVEFFEWLDGNCVDGVVDGVVDADVDALMSCDGLSALLKLVKWVEFDADPPRMRVVNFDRHNGETSKNRALKSERQAKWRAKSVDVPVDATPSTREEKRRVTTQRDKKIAAPTEEHVGIARDLNIDCALEWAKYLDQQANAKNRHGDRISGFRNWLRRAHEFKPPPLRAYPGGVSGKPTIHDKRAATAAAMYGTTQEPSNGEPNDITAESQRIA